MHTIQSKAIYRSKIEIKMNQMTFVLFNYFHAYPLKKKKKKKICDVLKNIDFLMIFFLFVNGRVKH